MLESAISHGQNAVQVALRLAWGQKDVMTKRSSSRVIFLSFHFFVLSSVPDRNHYRQSVVHVEATPQRIMEVTNNEVERAHGEHRSTNYCP
jgi:hypothetical protein